MNEKDFSDLKKLIIQQKKILGDINKNPEDSKLPKELAKLNDKIPEIMNRLNLATPLPSMSEKKIGEIPMPTKIENIPEKINWKSTQFQDMNNTDKIIKKTKMDKADREALGLQGDVIKRLKKKSREHVAIKEQKPNPYVQIANRMFSKVSLGLYKNEIFNPMKKDLIQANLMYLPVSYISTILLSTLIAFVASFFLVGFFLIFSFTIKFPFLVLFNGEIFGRILKTFWLIPVIPIGTFLIMFLYPSVERNFIKDKINQELPFVTIHMSSIAGSMLEPNKIFEIITITKEYPYTSKELTKVLNEINIYGYNFVSALRRTASNTASYKLAELLNGIATTITSGGDLQIYFEKKAESLLFDYRLQREKYTRMAETFMDIYISVVIAAPMILMLLLMMIKISGLGISLSTQQLTAIIVAGVSIVNIIFITFLYLKQPES
jgi:flagellar protein FlaJ